MLRTTIYLSPKCFLSSYYRPRYLFLMGLRTLVRLSTPILHCHILLLNLFYGLPNECLFVRFVSMLPCIYFTAGHGAALFINKICHSARLSS